MPRRMKCLLSPSTSPRNVEPGGGMSPMLARLRRPDDVRLERRSSTLFRSATVPGTRPWRHDPPAAQAPPPNQPCAEATCIPGARIVVLEAWALPWPPLGPAPPGAFRSQLDRSETSAPPSLVPLECSPRPVSPPGCDAGARCAGGSSHERPSLDKKPACTSSAWQRALSTSSPLEARSVAAAMSAMGSPATKYSHFPLCPPTVKPLSTPAPMPI
mmetsp:Transcript_3483/g.10748  ORF Transcript_3483/g.10748 Transcript_3483/m.10748 type:complete len:215 (-) Transcript_3483:754-1398(-)